MKKIDIDNFKASLMFLFVGVWGSVLDYFNGSKNLLPDFLSFSLLPEDKFAFIVIHNETTVHSSFLLFLALGSMLLTATMSGVKAKYTLKGYFKIIALKCKLKYYTGILEREEWLNDRKTSKIIRKYL